VSDARRQRPSRSQDSWVWTKGSWHRLPDHESDPRLDNRRLPVRPEPPDEYFTGQSTSSQLYGLRELEAIAKMQGQAVEAASFLALRHPRVFVSVLWRLRLKITLAAMNGLLAFLFGLGVQTAFIKFAGAGHFTAYVLQNIFSTQFSFLLARYITWRDRRVRFFPTLARYNLQQISTTLLSIILFAVLDKLYIQYALANFLVTIIVAPLSFLVAHKWSIAEREGSMGAPAWPAIAAGRSAN
jgi:putative flippase GtrA